MNRKSRNCMEKIAEMYGLRLNDLFIVEDSCGEWKCKFTNEGLYSVNANSDSEFSNDMRRLHSVITGRAKLIKLPWKPKPFEKYYIPRYDESGKAGCYLCEWLDEPHQEMSYKAGLVCRTEMEAMELANQMLEVARRRRND